MDEFKKCLETYVEAIETVMASKQPDSLKASLVEVPPASGTETKPKEVSKEKLIFSV